MRKSPDKRNHDTHHDGRIVDSESFHARKFQFSESSGTLKKHFWNAPEPRETPFPLLHAIVCRSCARKAPEREDLKSFLYQFSCVARPVLAASAKRIDRRRGRESASKIVSVPFVPIGRDAGCNAAEIQAPAAPIGIHLRISKNAKLPPIHAFLLTYNKLPKLLHSAVSRS